MPQTWPITLPLKPRQGTLQEPGDEAVHRSPADAGKPRVAQKYTKAIKYITGTFDLDNSLSPSQVTTLITFFETTCKNGSLPFDFTHPRTGAAVSVYFESRPIPRHVIGKWYQVDLNLRIE